jgi:hypothetical protein
VELRNFTKKTTAAGGGDEEMPDAASVLPKISNQLNIPMFLGINNRPSAQHPITSLTTLASDLFRLCSPLLPPTPSSSRRRSFALSLYTAAIFWMRRGT